MEDVRGWIGVEADIGVSGLPAPEVQCAAAESLPAMLGTMGVRVGRVRVRIVLTAFRPCPSGAVL